MFDHQIHNSIGNVYNAFIYEKTFYPPHFHKGFEFIYSIESGAQIEVNNRAYCLKQGDCLLIPPYVSHSLRIRHKNDCLVVVFSAQDAESATKQFASSLPTDYLFTIPSQTEDFIRQNLIFCPQRQEERIALARPPLLRLKACLYSIFDAFLSQHPLTETGSDGILLGKLIACIEEGYKTDLTLKDVAQKLGYSYDYLSRVFQQAFHINFKSIVNQYRCEHALHLLRTTERTLTDISLDSGFQSIRSFNRVFKEILGTSPSKFRKANE